MEIVASTGIAFLFLEVVALTSATRVPKNGLAAQADPPPPSKTRIPPPPICLPAKLKIHNTEKKQDRCNNQDSHKIHCISTQPSFVRCLTYTCIYA